MNLIKIYENRKYKKKESNRLRKEMEFDEALSNVIKCIFKGDDTFITDNVEFLKTLNIKKTQNLIQTNPFRPQYTVDLTTDNIQKIQNYIDGVSL